ncbi:MAG: biotin carboxylase [Bacteroidia bacterium]|nr:biotin carboxylase [Bacteroidia bacterium]MDW8159678.1 biotin carboxylase [Bacteroidia bacterium]
MQVMPGQNKRILKGLPEIRRFFFKNSTPIYFISPTNFNLLGLDEWVKSFKYISYIDCYDKQHPNVFVPSEKPHDLFESIEEVNNYLLEHKEVVDYINKRGPGGIALFLMFDEKTESLCQELDLKVGFPSAKLRNYVDNKVVTTRIAEKAGVPCVPNVLGKVSNYESLLGLAGDLGTDLVVQLPYGDSGNTTFFISSSEDWERYKDKITAEPEVKIMKRINCRGSAMEACVTRHGTIVAPLMTELIGFKSLTPYKGGWCGNELYADVFTPEIREQARKYTESFGNALREEGYIGYFELDFLIDTDTQKLYLGELNPRITGASSITNHAVFALADMPLFLFHLIEFMDVDYEIDVEEINQRWNDPDNIDTWSQLVLKRTEESLEWVTQAPPTGIWSMDRNGDIKFSRFDTHRRAVENEWEAFFLRIIKPGDVWYKGADLGILVTRGRLMTDDFKLNARAHAWISGLQQHFKTTPYEPHYSYKVPSETYEPFKLL